MGQYTLSSPLWSSWLSSPLLLLLLLGKRPLLLMLLLPQLWLMLVFHLLDILMLVFPILDFLTQLLIFLSLSFLLEQSPTPWEVFPSLCLLSQLRLLRSEVWLKLTMTEKIRALT